MFEAFQTIGSWGVTVFVITSMLNVGLTQGAVVGALPDPAAADPPRRER